MDIGIDVWRLIHREQLGFECQKISFWLLECVFINGGNLGLGA